MISQTDLSGKFAYDTKGLDQLRQTARKDAPEALRSTAQQFEALFLNMVMKSMRDATPKEDLFGSEQEKMMTGMLDQQLSQNLAKRGVGLADALVLQLSKTLTPRTDAADAAPLPNALSGLNGGVQQGLPAPRQASSLGNGVANDPSTANVDADPLAAGKFNRVQALSNALANDPNLRPFLPGRLGNMANRYLDNSSLDNAAKLLPPSLDAQKTLPDSAVAVQVRSNSPDHVKVFHERVGKHAEQASRETGIPAKFMLGQAALESGWGRHEIATADGSKSHNLFGVKATAGWKGKTVEATTTEFVNGVPTTKREKFRAYDSYGEGFRDYAKLLTKNPRYENVMNQTQDASSFAKGLQRAGYATDPHYASKLTRIINQSFI
jgi:peptidoglycan hydrolase FlgJ